MARINDPSITSIPSPPPTSVGQPVPDFGREGAGVAATVTGGVVLVEVPPHEQLVLFVQDGLRQKP
jgi:hypothetical protein